MTCNDGTLSVAFSYDLIGNRTSSATYDETGEAQVSTYVANALNQYVSRTTPGFAAVRGEADPDAAVTVNGRPAYRLGAYFFGGDVFDNSASGGFARLETYAALAQTDADGNDADDLVSSVTGQVYVAQSPEAFAYDADGNQTLVTTRTGRWRVEYNGENRPVRWTREGDGKTVEMSFDHKGRRRTKDGQRFFYDGYLQVANERTVSNAVVRQSFVWDPTEPVATRPLAWFDSNEPPRFYAHDGNKNVSEVVAAASGTNATVEVVAHYDYAAFGAVIAQKGDCAEANPWRFSSEYEDTELGLDYYNYRHYEPATGRWLSRDPIGEGRLCQLYLFCENSFATDSLGLVKIPIAPMIIGGPIVDLSPQEDCSVVLKRFEEWYEGEKRRLLNKDEQGKNWVERLPHCPNELKKDGSGFTSPDSSEWSMTWYFGITQFWGNYHPGGEYELRTKDPAEYGGNGNQCVYDKCGKLITEQPGAGTADWSSPEGKGNSHIRDDVKPFDDARYLESVCGLSGCINKYYEVRPSW